MSSISRINGFYRLATGMGNFLGDVIEPETCVSTVCDNMKMRERNFLQLVRRAVFPNPDSPYLKLLCHAGINEHDLEHLVHHSGLDPALEVLRDEGVYVSAEEFKGFKPAVRGSRSFQFQPEDFDNKLVKSVYASNTGGSLWRPTRVFVDLEHIGHTAIHYGLWFAANKWLECPLVYWTPAHVGIANSHLRCAKFGKPYKRWFSLATNTGFREKLIAGTVHRIVSKQARLPGAEPVPVQKVSRVSGYLSELLKQGEKPCVRTIPSGAVRISLAAMEEGESLAGVSFLLGGEALTSRRHEIISSSGASAFQTYGCAEVGPIACQCREPRQIDDVHVLKDAFAVLTRPRIIDDDTTVNSLMITSLRPAAPKVLLNTELGDYGEIEERECGCLFGRVGYTTHLHSVRSFQKLTGEGMTVVGDDLVGLIEHSLPKRFGGTMTDYQLLEEQDQNGLTRYSLLVSPELENIDESVLQRYLLGELKKIKSHYNLMISLWKSSGSIRIRRESPVLTGRGKLKPYRVIRDD